MNKNVLRTLSIFGGLLGVFLIGFIALIYLQPQIPIYIGSRIWSTYSEQKTPYAYIVPSDTIVLEKVNNEKSLLKGISVGPIEIFIPSDVNTEEMRFRTGNVVIKFPDKGYVFVEPNLPAFAPDFIESPNFDKDRFTEV